MTVDAEEIVAKAPVSTVTELLNGRAPGVAIINTTGMLGGGNRVRIRGASSFSLSNEPLVYVDGVRVNNDQSTGPVNQAFGSRSISRWNDINPEDIQSIEIIKGPAAATLYGTEASNGVVQIITKKGQAGAPRLNLSVKQGANWFANPEGRLWTNYFDVEGDGTVESIDLVDLENQRGNEIWRTGHVQQYDLSVAGGADIVRYYISGNFENSTGVEFDNALRKWGGRANVSVRPNETWEIGGNIGYITGRTDLALEAGGGGATWSTYFARPDRNEPVVIDGATVPNPRRGFWSGTPESYNSLWDSWQDLERTMLSFDLRHQPAQWFNHRLTIGRDYTREQDNELMNHDEEWLYFFSFADRGYKETWDRSTDYTTADYVASLNLPVNEELTTSTSVGGQFYRRYQEFVYAYGEAFPVPALTSIAATTQNRQNSEFSVENVTVGVFLQEQLGWNNRLFLTGALRADDNSAFGQNFDFVTYPKVSASWVVTEEPFWSFGPVSTLKLRAAYGESGQQPDAFVAIQTFNPVAGPNDIGTVTPANLGNPDLGPERGREIEFGFDAGLFDERLGVEFTYYSQRTRDAILLREIAPSTGFSGLQYVNAGEIANSGVELLIRGEPWRTDRHGLDLSFNVATNSNEVLDLGEVTDEDFISIGSYARHQIGHPVGSWFAPRVVSAELVDGVATNLLCDNGAGGTVDCASAPSVYLGRTTPKVEGGFNSTLTLFDRIQLFGQIDFKTGFSKLDGNYRVRCFFFSECRENWFPQEFDAVTIAEIQAAGPYPSVLIDDADFAKLREVSLSYSVPESWAGRFGASSASITLGRPESLYLDRLPGARTGVYLQQRQSRRQSYSLGAERPAAAGAVRRHHQRELLRSRRCVSNEAIIPSLPVPGSCKREPRRFRGGAARNLVRGGLFALGVAALAGGCDVNDLLNVDAPDRIPAEGLITPQNAELLVNGAVGDFECAYGAYVALSGVIAGELTDATQTAARWPYDRRNVDPTDALYSTSDCEGLGIYEPLSRARWSADNVLERLQEWTDQEVSDRQLLITRAAVFSGYSYLLLAEAFCTVAIDLSPELQPEEVLQTAVERFTTALGAAQAAGAGDLENLALVGRARAYLDLGQGAQALADAELVPEDFVFLVTTSEASSRRNNRIFGQSGEPPSGGSALSVGSDYRDFQHMGVPDPRVPVSDFIRENADGTPLYVQLKYESLSDPLPLATGDEAQLIIAEVAGGQRAVDIINEFHAEAGLPAFSSADEAEIRDHVIAERQAELWLEGHRFHDIRRLNLPLDPAPGTPYRKGGTYGDDRCFPLPDVEVRNNPNI